VVLKYIYIKNVNYLNIRLDYVYLLAKNLIGHVGNNVQNNMNLVCKWYNCIDIQIVYGIG